MKESKILKYLDEHKKAYLGGGCWSYDNVRACIIASSPPFGSQAHYKNKFIDVIFVNGSPLFNFSKVDKSR